MRRACERAVELGLPAIAFTEHLDFTVWDPDDRATAQGLVDRHPSRQRRSTSRAVRRAREARERFPELRVCRGWRPASRTCSGPAWPPTCGDAPVDRVLGSLHSLPVDGRLMGVNRLLPARRHRDDAPLPRRARGHDRDQRRLPGAGARRLPAALLARRAAPVPREDLRGGVPRGVPRAGRQRPGPRGQHQQPAGLGGPGALVPRGGRGGGQLRQRRPPAAPVGQQFDLAVDVVEAAGFRPGRDRFDFWRR